MTNEQILEFAEQHFSFITEYTATGWIADTEDLLNFARTIRQDGYSEGYDEGWESSNVNTEMNTWRE